MENNRQPNLPSSPVDELLQRMFTTDDRQLAESLLQQIIEIAAPRLKMIAFTRLRNPDDVEDALQETQISIWKSWETDRHKPEQRPRKSAWLYSIIYNKAVDICRSKSRRLKREQPSPILETFEGRDGEQRRLAMQSLYDSIEELEAKDQDLLSFYLAGLNNTQTAAALQISEASVREKIKKLVPILRGKMEIKGVTLSVVIATLTALSQEIGAEDFSPPHIEFLQTPPPVGISAIVKTTLAIAAGIALLVSAYVFFPTEKPLPTPAPPSPVRENTAPVFNTDMSASIKRDGIPGYIRAWGSNLDRQCEPVDGLSDIIDLVATGYDTYGLRTDGTLLALGRNRDGTNALNGSTRVAKFAANSYHALVQFEDGMLLACGNNEQGQLGIGTTDKVDLPVKVEGIDGEIAQLCCGPYHSVALMKDGTVFTWGGNKFNQLGDGTTTDRYKPARIAGLTDVIYIACGHLNNFAVKRDGTVWRWGACVSVPDQDELQPIARPERMEGITNPKKIVPCSNFVLFLTGDGEVLAYGSNAWGQLGDGTFESRNELREVPLPGAVADLFATQLHAFAVMEDGLVYGWGQNYYSQIIEALGQRITTPVEIPALRGALKVATAFDHSVALLPYKGVDITAGEGHTLMISGEKKLFACGRNDFGQLGTGDDITYNTPQLVASLNEKRVIAVSAGQYHSLALCSDGSVYSWGRNDKGQLGLGDQIDRPTPQLVAALSGKMVIEISCGNSFSMAVTTQGGVFSWGSNEDGQLGLGEIPQSFVDIPSPVSALSDLRISSVCAGGFHAFALDWYSSVFAWGQNRFGQLGLGDFDGYNTPMLIEELQGKFVTALSAGQFHSFAIAADRTVYSWGMNASGQLGHGHQANLQLPEIVAELAGRDVVQISAGWEHSIAICRDNSIFSWGSSGYGQHGSGDDSVHQFPTPVPDFSEAGIAHISAGVWFCIASCGDGSIYSWGQNDFGQLGLGHVNNMNTPQRIHIQ